MLYISRYVDNDHYGVVDTDDGVEQIVAYDYLQSSIVKHRVRVVGVKHLCDAFDTLVIEPYQLPETLTTLQIKTRLMKFVDVKVYNGMITSVIWDANRIDSPVSVRLSDFGGIVADKFIIDNVGCCEDKVTLVLDDKLRYHFFSFKGTMQFGANHVPLEHLGVTLDMRELNEHNAKSAYYLLSDAVAFDCMHHCVLDNPDRLRRVENERNGYLCGGPDKPSFL